MAITGPIMAALLAYGDPWKVLCGPRFQTRLRDQTSTSFAKLPIHVTIREDSPQRPPNCRLEWWSVRSFLLLSLCWDVAWLYKEQTAFLTDKQIRTNFEIQHCKRRDNYILSKSLQTPISSIQFRGRVNFYQNQAERDVTGGPWKRCVHTTFAWPLPLTINISLIGGL